MTTTRTAAGGAGTQPALAQGVHAEVHLGTCRLIHADYAEALADIADFDLVITSPPYNLGGEPWPHLGNWKYGRAMPHTGSKWRNGAEGSQGARYRTHEDAMAWSTYVQWQQQTLAFLWKRLPSHGAIFYVHKPRVIGSCLWTPLTLLPPEVTLRQIIIWSRPGGMNYTPTAFVPMHEWIMVLAKADFRLKSQGVSGLGDVWPMVPDANPHPAPFPLALPMRVLEATHATHVLDPFAGSFTTGVAAAQHGIAFTGCEIDEGYWQDGCKRIESTYAQLDFLRPCRTGRVEQMALI